MANWEEIDQFLRNAGVRIGPPRVEQTTGGVHAKNSNHFKGLARDYGDVDSDCRAVVAAVLPQKHLLLELYYAPLNVWHPRNVGGHSDHVHVAVRADARLGGDPPGHPPWPGRLLNVVTRGEDMRVWQQQMARRGWRISADGIYGPASREVCMKFQQEKGLAVDGVVGSQTWDAAWTAPTT